MTGIALPLQPDPALRTIVTPEGIGLPLTLASRGSRLAALVLDILLQGVVAGGALVVLFYLGVNLTRLDHGRAGQGSYASAMQFLQILFLICGFLLHNGWFMFFEMGPRGATPGKRMVGIRVAARSGGALTADMIIARNLLRDIELFMPLGFIGMAAAGEGGPGGLAAAVWFGLFALFPFFNRDRLRAGDLIAGTWVVDTRKPRLLPVVGMVIPVEGEPSETPGYRFGEAELAIYGEHELQTLERVLRDNRPDTQAAVAAAICARIGWSAPGTAETPAFLQAFYTQQRARLESGLRFGKRKSDKFS